MTLLLPYATWFGFVAACGVVGGCLGSAVPEAPRRDVRSALRTLGLLAALMGDALALRDALNRLVGAHFATAALWGPGAVLLASLGLAAVTAATLGNPRAAVAGSVMGTAAAVCAFGPGIPLVFYGLVPVGPDLATLATLVPAFAAALAAHRVGGPAARRRGGG